MGCEGEHAWTMTCAKPANIGTSTPMAAAGIIPKSESAEYRPPMLGRPKNIRQNPSRSATCCIFDPGSVMATKCVPSRPERSKKYCLKIFGSSVDPDLLETIKDRKS